jgi:hypothetical protein
MFTVDEVRYLVGYTEKIVFEAVQSNLGTHGDEEFEEISLRLLRRWGRLLVYPELILEERPREKTRVRGRSLSIEDRDLLFQLLGNRSHAVVSLSDDELVEETMRQIRDYH